MNKAKSDNSDLICKFHTMSNTIQTKILSDILVCIESDKLLHIFNKYKTNENNAITPIENNSLSENICDYEK